MADHPHLILPPGVTQADASPTGGHPIRRAATGELRDLARDFAPFTTALLHTRIGIPEDRDPVGEFIATHPDRSCDAAVRDFGVQLFDGMGTCAADAYWDSRLFFVERRFWPDLLAFLSGIVVADTPRRRFHVVIPQAVPLPARRRTDGTIERPYATVFCPSGNDARFVVSVKPGVLPRVLRIRADPRTVAQATSVFRQGAEAIEYRGG